MGSFIIPGLQINADKSRISQSLVHNRGYHPYVSGTSVSGQIIAHDICPVYGELRNACHVHQVGKHRTEIYGVRVNLRRRHVSVIGYPLHVIQPLRQNLKPVLPHRTYHAIHGSGMFKQVLPGIVLVIYHKTVLKGIKHHILAFHLRYGGFQ